MIHRITMPVRSVLRLFLDSKPGSEWAGVNIGAETGLGAGTLYTLLHRLEDAGWLSSRWESQKVAAKAGRPQKRFYKMTAQGRKEAGGRLNGGENVKPQSLD
jgi:DNA-binding transcriptional regulator PaaX